MKKAILVVSFGTSHLDVLKKSIFSVEDAIKNEYKDYHVYRAFTSHFIIKKLREKHGMIIQTPEEALFTLANNYYDEVIVQPLHIVAGEEYHYIKRVTSMYEHNFKTLKLGRPIFYYQGIDNLPNDYSLFIDSISDVLNRNKATVLIGHGTSHPSTSAYGCLQSVLEDEGYDNVFVGTVKSYPGFETVLNRVIKRNIDEVTLMPILLVAGNHMKNDIASDMDDSWKSKFEAVGIKVNILMKGLGEFDKFNKLYVNRIEDLIEDRYNDMSKNKKGNMGLK